MVKKKKNRKLTLLVDVTYENCEKWTEEECRLALKETMEKALHDLVEDGCFCIPAEVGISYKKKPVGKFRLVYH